MAKKLDNFTLIIFGAGGDLASRRIIPSVYRLYQSGNLPERCRIIGVDLQDMELIDFRHLVYENIKKHAPEAVKDEKHFKQFCSEHLFYVSGDFNDPSTVERMLYVVNECRDAYGMCDNLLYYFSTPPAAAPLIFKMLKNAGLDGKNEKAPGWRRIIIEKPFGQDLLSARKLNSLVAEGFKENQIFRMDNLPSKECLQNILVFRFGNGIFDSVWNNRHVDYVEITIAEDSGVDHRGAYYEQAGLIRDVILNHGLQLLALAAMEAPSSLDAEVIRDERIKVIKSIKSEDLVIGQYEGYREENGVARDSMVETFAAVKFYVSNPRWRGVPFYLRAGKMLAEQLTEIVVHFKNPTCQFFGRTREHAEANRVTLKIHPEQKISVLFGAKRPGEDIIIDPVRVEIDLEKQLNENGLVHYHLLLKSAMAGDPSLFPRRDGIEECWQIIDNIKARLKERVPSLYPAKSWGPGPAGMLIEKDGFQWRLN